MMLQSQTKKQVVLTALREHDSRLTDSPPLDASLQLGPRRGGRGGGGGRGPAPCAFPKRVFKLIPKPKLLPVLDKRAARLLKLERRTCETEDASGAA